MVQQLMAVVLVLGLLFGALWLLRRKSLSGFALLPKQAGGVRQLRVIERVSLSPQHSVHLVQVADTLLVVGVSPAGCNSLASLPPSTVARSIQVNRNVSGSNESGAAE
jgi:flagellar biosynthetic protein FliO